MSLFGILFGIGLFVASLLFRILHAFNGFNLAVGFSSLDRGWGFSTTSGGLFFGVIEQKTGRLLSPDIAHDLPDAVGEPLRIIFGW